MCRARSGFYSRPGSERQAELRFSRAAFQQSCVSVDSGQWAVGSGQKEETGRHGDGETRRCLPDDSLVLREPRAATSNHQVILVYLSLSFALAASPHLPISASPHLRLSPSPHLPVSASPCRRVSLSPRLPVAASLCLPHLPSLRSSGCAVH